VLAAMLAGATPTRAGAPFPGPVPGTPIGMNLPADVEPSDIIFHPRLHQLFVVSDNGWLYQMSPDGSVIENWFIGGDLEGLCVANPEKNTIYVAVEVPYRIYEFDFEQGEVTRTFDLSPWIQTPWNLGIEALTYIPGSAPGAGGVGRFLVGLQLDGSIHEFRLPLGSTTDEISFLGTWTPVPGRVDLAAMAYDRGTDILYLVYDDANLLRAIRPNGAFVNEWQLPGEEQEGIALDSANCDLYIAQDTGQVLRYSNFPASDSDMDNVPDCRDLCPNSPPRSAVNADGCACVELDDDHDGVDDCDDWCDGTPTSEAADWRGCSCSQIDSDGDGVNNCRDQCPDTRPNTPVDRRGCPLNDHPVGDVDQIVHDQSTAEGSH